MSNNMDYLDNAGEGWTKKQTIGLILAFVVLAGLVAIFMLFGGTAEAEGHVCDFPLVDITYDNVGEQHNEVFWYRCSCGNGSMIVGGSYDHNWVSLKASDEKLDDTNHTHHDYYTCTECGATKDVTTEVAHTWTKTGTEYKAINYYFQHDRIDTYTCTECGETKTETTREAHQHGGEFISITAANGACYDKRICPKCGDVSSEEHTHQKKPGGAVYGPFYLWGNNGANGHTEYYSYECYCTSIASNRSKNLIFEYGTEVLPHTFEHVGWKTYEILYVGEEIPESVELVRCTTCEWEGHIDHEHKWETLTSKEENGETVYGGTCACGVTKWFHVHNYVNTMTYENSIYQVYFDVCTICGQKVNKTVVYKQDYDRSYKPTTLTPTAPIDAENPVDIIEGRFTASDFCYIGRWSAQFDVDEYEYLKYWSNVNGITTFELIDAETGAIAFCHAKNLITK